MSKGPRTAPELINAIRGCAARELSASEAAAELSTPTRMLTRNSVIGIAHRNGVSFAGKRRQGNRVPKPRTVRHAFKPAPTTAPPPHVVASKSDWRTPLPGLVCSWSGCGEHAELGDMFCFSHGKRPLFSA